MAARQMDARAARESGNEAFKRGDHAGAEALYADAVRLARAADARDELCLSLGNHAAALMHLGKPSQAVVDCDEALRLGAGWKILMRKATALQELLELDEAASAMEAIFNLPSGRRPPANAEPMVMRKRAELIKLAREYEPPRLPPLERRALFNEQHTLRVFVQDLHLGPELAVGRTTSTVHVFLGNEFGLFRYSAFESPLRLSCRLWEVTAWPTPVDEAGARAWIRVPTPGAEQEWQEQQQEKGDNDLDPPFSEHGRVKGELVLDIPEALRGKLIQVEFAASEGRVQSALTLPLRVGATVDDPVAAAFLATPGAQQASSYRRMHMVDGLPPVHLLEAPGSLGIAGKLWDGAIVLAQHLAEQRELVTGKNLIELGAGTGALGIACAMLGAASVLTTDLGEVVPQLEANVALNEAVGSVTSGVLAPRALAWGETQGAEDSISTAADLVVFADCVYDPDLYEALLSTLEALCSRHGCSIVWAHRHRNPEDHRFFEGLIKRGFASRLAHGPGPAFLSADKLDLAALTAAYSGAAPCEANTHRSGDVSIYLSTLATR